MKHTGIFELGKSGVHMSLVGFLPLADMASMADSALGPAIKEVHVTMDDIGRTWQATMPFQSVFGYLGLLSSLRLLSIKG